MLFDFLSRWFKRVFQGVRHNTIVVEHSPNIDLKEIELQAQTSTESKQHEEIVITPEATLEPKEKVEDKTSLLISKEIFQSWRIDLNTAKPFLPNWGDLDPTVSTISDGREHKDRLNYLYEEFLLRYGNLTTDLGYGLIYSIVMNAIEKEDRTVSSALREAIVRSGDPLLCVAVVKDYCVRKSIQFDRYERITLDILKRREVYYHSRAKVNNEKSQIDLKSLSLGAEESQTLDKTQWLFNGTVVKIERLYLIVKIPTLKDAQLIREFNKCRVFKSNQNVVVQWEGDNNYRILDFKIPSKSS